MVASYDLWSGNGAGLFLKERVRKKVKKKISVEAYDVNKHTIYIAQK